MTSAHRSATLFREGPDLDALLADLDDEHDGAVRVVDVTYGRDGGVLGFFAKRSVGVHYVVDDAVTASPDDVPAARTRFDAVGPAAAGGALEELLRAAEQAESDGVRTAAVARTRTPASVAAAEAIVTSGRVPAELDDTDDAAPNVEFARMLLDLAASKAAQRTTEPTPATALPATPLALPVFTAPTITAPTITPAEPADREAAAPAAPLAWSAPPAAPARTPGPQVWTAPPPVPRTVTAPVAPTPPAAPAAPTAPTPPARHAAPAPAPVVVTPGRHAAPDTAPVLTRPAPVIDQPAPARAARGGAHRATRSEDGSRTEYTLRRQLAEAGVPLSWIPERTADVYWIVEELVAQVPTAAPLDLQPGGILVVAGTGPAALDAARRAAEQLHLNTDALVAVGFDDAGDLRAIDQRWQALGLVADVRERRQSPVVVALNTDTDDAPWLASMTAALAPDVLWHVVDATSKPADAKQAAARLGRRVDGLVVVNAARTASPASVWELDVPIAVVDGRPSTRGAWAVLLIDTLAALGA